MGSVCVKFILNFSTNFICGLLNQMSSTSCFPKSFPIDIAGICLFWKHFSKLISLNSDWIIVYFSAAGVVCFHSDHSPLSRLFPWASLWPLLYNEFVFRFCFFYQFFNGFLEYTDFFLISFWFLTTLYGFRLTTCVHQFLQN